MDNETDKQTAEVIQGVDPVSGNEIPVGSSAKEVRDDVDAKLSENEYVIPADVVRFYGVSHFEKLISKAKEGYAKMVEEGRFGGSPSEDEDLPFSDEELSYEDDEELLEEEGQPVAMAEGGSVPEGVPQSTFNPEAFSTGFSTYGQQGSNPFSSFGSGIQSKIYVNASGERRSIMFSNGVPIQAIPDGFMEDTPTNREALASASATTDTSVTPLSEDSRAGRGDEEDYGEKEVADYTSMTPEQRERETRAGAGLAGLVGGMLGGPLGAAAAKGLAASEQRKQMEEQGLSPSEIESVLGKRKEGPLSKIGDGVNKIFGDRRNKNDIIGEGKAGNEGKTSKPDFGTRDDSGNSGQGGTDGYGRGEADYEKDDSKKSSGYNKGGLVKRRGKPNKNKSPKSRGLATRR